jgi:nitrilase
MEKAIVASVQAAPVFLDREATIDKACGLIKEAASNGARLIAFPEAFVPTYPDWVWRAQPWDEASTALYAQLFQESVEIPGPATERLGDAARGAGAYVAVGVTERAGSTLYNTVVFLSPEGELIGRHRKLMPTGGERLVWGFGDGSTLTTFDTPFGRVGALICWENYMPLARAAMYARGIDILLAPTWDNSDVWVPTLRHIAKEGRVFVVGITPCQRGLDVPADVPGRNLWRGEDDWMSRGNSTIVDPSGDILAGPLIGEEGILYATVDASAARASRFEFDVVGHYACPDVFQLHVDERALLSVVTPHHDPHQGVPSTSSPEETSQRIPSIGND